jgi:integrase
MTRRDFGAIRKLKSKRYQASYLGPDGIRRPAPHTFDSRGDAEAWLNQRRREIEGDEWRPTVKPGPPLLFVTYAEQWLADAIDRDNKPLKPKTVLQYRWLLDDWILPTFAEKPLRAIDSDMVEEWHREIGKRKVKTTRVQAYNLLSSILGAAAQKRDSSGRRLREYNPCQIRGAGTRPKRKKKIRVLTQEELAALVEAMPEKHRLMVMLAVWCQLRFGELTELRRSDIDLRRGRILVERGVVTLPGGERHVDTPKSDAGERGVHIPPHLMPMVRAHMAANIAGGRDGLLFPGKDGRQLSTSSFYGRAPGTRDKRTGRLLSPWGFYAARAKAGRPDLNFHGLRHTGATWAAQNGATLKELMVRLGHATPDAALLYQHATDERDAEIARKLSEMARRRLKMTTPV